MAEDELEEILAKEDDGSISFSIDKNETALPEDSVKISYNVDEGNYVLNPEQVYFIQKLATEMAEPKPGMVDYSTAIFDIPVIDDTYGKLPNFIKGVATPDGITINWKVCWGEDGSVENHEAHHYRHHFAVPMPTYQAEASADYAAGTRH